jgi:membrane protease YdiL (CAAX protease family)
MHALGFLIIASALALLGTSIWLWRYVYLRWRTGRPILDPIVPLPWVPWGLVDLGLLSLLLITLQLTLTTAFARLPAPEQVIRLEELRDSAAELDGRPGTGPAGRTDGEADEPPGRESAAATSQVQQERILWTMVLSYALWFCLGVGGLYAWKRLTPADLGFDRARLADDVRLGAAAFCLLAPVVYGIQLVMVQIWPSEHPLVDMIREDETGRLLWLGAFTAVAVAPLFEELAFRLFLQGWLENLVRIVNHEPLPKELHPAEDAESPSDPHWHLLIWGWSGSRPAGVSHADPLVEKGAEGLEDHWAEDARRGSPSGSPVSGAGRHESGAVGEAGRLAGELPTGRGATNPYTFQSREVEPQRVELPPPRGVLLVTPIVVSSVIFALLHYSHGPDWIALLVLALGLGYLYQRTRRIVPCIVVHLLLNATSFAMLLVEMTKDS